MAERSTIYLDIDDDITAIIGKLKKATHPEVALVAPKRSNVLNSAVNLKLIKKSAHGASKTAVLITDDSAISRLAGGLGMLVASNLKAEPAVPDVPKPGSHQVPSDVIEGQAIGESSSELAAAEKAQQTYQTPTAAGSQPTVRSAKAASSSSSAAAEKPTGVAAKKSKIPDFNRFKKRLLLGVGGLIAFILLLLALFFWLPQATISISGTTQRLSLDSRLTVDTDAKDADNAQALLPAKTQSLEKTLSSSFAPTGKKDLGTKATGTISIRNCEDSNARGLSSGARFTSSGGKVYTSDTAVTVPAGSFSGGGTVCNSSTVDVAVSAIEKGDSYNIAATSYTNPNLSGKFNISGSQMSGGSSKVATVVTQQDIDTAKNQLLETQRSAGRKELETRFNSDQYIIKESLAEDVKSLTSNPALDQEGTSATLSLRVSYSETAVERKQLEELIKVEATKQAKQKDNKALGVVDAGLDKATFKPLTKTATAQDFQLKTDVLLGPDINFDELKAKVGGKNFSDTVEIVKAYPNVTSVDVKFSPFYVRSVPKKPSKINVKIEVPR